LFERTRFWEAFQEQPLSRREWLEAIRVAPGIKDNFHTILSERDCLPEAERLLNEDPQLSAVFE
jgi:glycerol-1-phosphate dehydrogenase [NAD(P)+]